MAKYINADEVKEAVKSYAKEAIDGGVTTVDLTDGLLEIISRIESLSVVEKDSAFDTYPCYLGNCAGKERDKYGLVACSESTRCERYKMWRSKAWKNAVGKLAGLSDQRGEGDIEYGYGV